MYKARTGKRKGTGDTTKQGKRYYWLKLHENFFRQAVIRFLRKMPEGDSIVIIYLELLLMSIKTDDSDRRQGG